MRKLGLWVDLIFVTVDGTLISILFTIKINFGRALITIMKGREVSHNQEFIGKVTLTELIKQECHGTILPFKLKVQLWLISNVILFNTGILLSMIYLMIQMIISEILRIVTMNWWDKKKKKKLKKIVQIKSKFKHKDKNFSQIGSLPKHKWNLFKWLTQK